jgi:hypothetical protein
MCPLLQTFPRWFPLASHKSGRKYPLPPEEFPFVFPASAHPYGVVLSQETFKDHFRL